MISHNTQKQSYINTSQTSQFKYRNNSRLLFTDTDSLMYEIPTEDVYENFSKDKEIFDFSNYSAKPKYYDE